MSECDGCGWPTRHLTATDFGRVCDACAAGGPPADITRAPLTLDEAGAA